MTLYPGPNFETRIDELRAIQTHEEPDIDGNDGEMETIHAIPNQIFDQMYALLAAIQQIGPFLNPSIGASRDGNIQLMWTTWRLCIEIQSNQRITMFNCYPDGYTTIHHYNLPNDALGKLIYERLSSFDSKA